MHGVLALQIAALKGFSVVPQRKQIGVPSGYQSVFFVDRYETKIKIKNFEILLKAYMFTL